MRIGIDIRNFTHPQNGGFNTYFKIIIRALSKIDFNNKYISATMQFDGASIKT